MTDFPKYFNRSNIIKLLCKNRISCASSKHKHHLLADISSSHQVIKDFKEKSNLPVELSRILPPRRSWYHANKSERARFSDAQKLWLFSLQKTISIMDYKSKGADFKPPSWYKELELFIKKIQDRIDSPETQRIGAPEIIPVKKNNGQECRPISMYESLSDRIIISLTAKYFTEVFDDHFSESSYAFRAVKKIDELKISRSHHDAVEKILEFRTEHRMEDIYVAECDIQKFFDCLNHDTIIETLLSLSSRFEIRLDDSAVVFFKQYLDSYSFSKNVFPLNGTDYFQKWKMPDAKFKWVDTELTSKFYGSDELSEISIGVPQGGALSCFISNLILHSVDEAVLNMSNKNLMYLRFCDDMILLHTDKKRCEEALERYETAIENLRLVIHEPKLIMEYSKDFWETKSKRPYKWSASSEVISNIPWLAFVGYQINRDGRIRVRKKSITKELEKQKDECRLILKALNHSTPGININSSSRKSLRQQLFALESRLISMSVGRINLHEKDKTHSLCWTNSFKMLTPNKTSLAQLKMLDRGRTKALSKVKKKLRDLVRTSKNPKINLNGFYYGSPFSYHNFLMQGKFLSTCVQTNTG